MDKSRKSPTRHSLAGPSTSSFSSSLHPVRIPSPHSHPVHFSGDHFASRTSVRAPVLHGHSSSHSLKTPGPIRLHEATQPRGNRSRRLAKPRAAVPLTLGHLANPPQASSPLRPLSFDPRLRFSFLIIGAVVSSNLISCQNVHRPSEWSPVSNPHLRPAPSEPSHPGGTSTVSVNPFSPSFIWCSLLFLHSGGRNLSFHWHTACESPFSQPLLSAVCLSGSPLRFPIALI